MWLARGLYEPSDATYYLFVNEPVLEDVLDGEEEELSMQDSKGGRCIGCVIEYDDVPKKYQLKPGFCMKLDTVMVWE